MAKKFLAVWGDGYAKPELRQVSGDSFCDGNGYEVEDIEAIQQLKVGEVYSLSGTPSGDHVVIRLGNSVVANEKLLAGIDPVKTAQDEFERFAKENAGLFVE